MTVSQQYDSYQGIVNKMSQKDIDRFSENLQVVFPGLSSASKLACSGGTGGQCYQYTLTINNLAGIGTQIARIYIGSLVPVSVCPSGFCILDGKASATVRSFSGSSSFINPSESQHQVILWLDGTVQVSSGFFSIVTTRGRVFSFQFPIPQPQHGGGLDIGCVSIYFDPNLITYTSSTSIIPRVPAPGGWTFPGKDTVIFYIRLQNICAAVVKLLDKSALTMLPYTGSGIGAAPSWYIIAPMDQSYCSIFPPAQGQAVYCVPTNQGGTLGKGNKAPTSKSGTGNIPYAYNATQLTCNLASNPCYELPPAPAQGEVGLPVYILFSGNGPNSNTANNLNTNPGGTFEVLMALFYQCETTAGYCNAGYEYGVTIPFVTLVTS
jgi:hypothetical protein